MTLTAISDNHFSSIRDQIATPLRVVAFISAYVMLPPTFKDRTGPPFISSNFGVTIC